VPTAGASPTGSAPAAGASATGSAAPAAGTAPAAEPPVAGDALRELATRRLEAVRKAIAVDPARLPGRARRAPLIEAGGTSRVELDLRPEPDEVSSSAER
jgi:hypothetical protein